MHIFLQKAWDGVPVSCLPPDDRGGIAGQRRRSNGAIAESSSRRGSVSTVVPVPGAVWAEQRQYVFAGMASDNFPFRGITGANPSAGSATFTDQLFCVIKLAMTMFGSTLSGLC